MAALVALCTMATSEVRGQAARFMAAMIEAVEASSTVLESSGEGSDVVWIAPTSV